VHWHANQWDSADIEFRLAIAADSTSAAAHTQYGRYLLIVSRVAEAVQQLRTARRLDPLAPTSSVWLSYALAQTGDKAAAMAEAKRARELDPDLVTVRTIMVFGVLAAGTLDQARGELPARLIVIAKQDPSTLDGVESAEDKGEAEPGWRRWSVLLEPGVAAGDVLERCVAKQFPLRRFEQVQASLHDVFVHIVGTPETAQ